MSLWVHQPVPIEVGPNNAPTAFTWRGVTYRVCVVGCWRLATRWWDAGWEADRTYYRVEAADHQVFELYCDATQGNCWMLDVIQD
jgi:uncharacterized protein DUF6504